MLDLGFAVVMGTALGCGNNRQLVVAVVAAAVVALRLLFIDQLTVLVVTAAVDVVDVEFLIHGRRFRTAAVRDSVTF